MNLQLENRQLTIDLKTVMKYCLRLSRIICFLLLLCFLLSGIGCTRYQIGSKTLYPQEIRTVYVPIFDSRSYRRGLGERITEAVVKEIELKTPYKVVGRENADAILTGELVQEDKRLAISSPTNEGRQKDITLSVRVTFTNQRTGEVMRVDSFPAPVDVIQGYTSQANALETASFVPESGQSLATAHQIAINRIAERIVSFMEIPW